MNITTRTTITVPVN